MNVSVDVSSRAVMELCREVGALYIDTVAEPWAGFYLDESAGPEARTTMPCARSSSRRRRKTPVARQPLTAAAQIRAWSHGWSSRRC